MGKALKTKQQHEDYKKEVEREFERLNGKRDEEFKESAENIQRLEKGLEEMEKNCEGLREKLGEAENKLKEKEEDVERLELVRMVDELTNI